MRYYVCLYFWLHHPALHSIYSYWVEKNLICIIRSVETKLRRWTLVVVVINVDDYPFPEFSDVIYRVLDTKIDVFWLHCAIW